MAITSGRSARTRRNAVAVAIAVNLFQAALCQPIEATEVASVPPPQTFTVRDAIEWVTIANLAGDFKNPEPALFSPRGTYLLVQTSQAKIDSGSVHDQLLLYRTSSVQGSLGHAPRGVEPPTVIAEFDSANAWDQPSGITWIDENEIALLAPDASGVRQIFTKNVADLRRPRQLTSHPSNIRSFAIRSGRIVYYADHVASAVPPLARTAEEAGSLSDLICSGPSCRSETPLVDLFVASIGGDQPRRVDLAPARVYAMFADSLSLSPDGAFAIVSVPVYDWPDYWQEYNVAVPSFFRFTSERKGHSSSSGASVRTQLHLLDLESATVRPLIDAPSGFLSGNQTPARSFWLDERRVVVSNTYLPLTGVDSAERRKRQDGPATAEIDVISGKASTVFWEPSSNASLERIQSLAWLGNSRTLAVTSKSSERVTRRSYIRRPGGAWRAEASPSLMPPLSVRVQQTTNTPPRVVVRGSQCQCERVILDPNPQWTQFAFGHLEVIKWTDRNQISWKGGLLYPIDYKPGRSYPLVVQTHGFDESEFLVSGPRGATTGVAAQPLATAGMFVLQVEDNKSIAFDENEDARYAEGYRAGIQKLVAAGLADEANIGLQVFSRTGFAGLTLLARNPDLISAMVISDAFVATYSAFLQQVHLDADVRVQVNAAVAPPVDLTGKSIGEWLANNPTYRISRSSAAVRLESLGAGTALSMWETYAVLRYSGRPAEFVYIPGDRHQLFNPQRRLASQGGAFDWFRFWLQNCRDTDPAKDSQYARWNGLRELRHQSVRQIIN